MKRNCNEIATELKRNCNVIATELKRNWNELTTKLQRNWKKLQRNCNGIETKLKRNCNGIATELPRNCNEQLSSQRGQSGSPLSIGRTNPIDETNKSTRRMSRVCLVHLLHMWPLLTKITPSTLGVRSPPAPGARRVVGGRGVASTAPKRYRGNNITGLTKTPCLHSVRWNFQCFVL